MDPATASPEAPDRPASSPEPVPTRPNPFDDENNSARKRRRTSPVDSPTATSPLRSSSPAGPQDHPTTSSDTVMVHAEDADSPATASTTMHVDPNTSLPSTPEGPQPADFVPDPPSSSRVTTINLRQHGGLDGGVSSPDTSSPEASSPSDGRDRLVTSDLNMPDVDSDLRRDSAPSGDDDTPTSSTLGASSPELVEAVDQSRSTEAAGATRPPEDLDAAITGDLSNFDFAADFPFLTPNESLPQVVGRILNFLESSGSGSPSGDDGSSDENVITSLNAWIAKCVVWFQQLSLDRAIACVQGHQNFWARLVDLILFLNHKRHKYPAYSQSRALANAFLQRAGSLAAAFVAIDVKNLNRHRTDPDFADAPTPHILSSHLLSVFAPVARQSRQLASEDAQSALLTEEPVGIVQTFTEATGGGLGSLLKLIQIITSLIPRYPRLADAPSAAVSASAAVLNDTMFYASSDLIGENEVKARLAIGHQIFEVAADAFSISIDKHLTHLNPARTEALVTSFGEILIHTLTGGHPNAVERVKQHRLDYPGIAEHLIALAICHEWRLSILCRLIKCSQMQLRVTAVRMANEELVRAWKTHNNDQPGNRAFMRHLAAHLDSTRIVEYILDPACHPEITGQSGNIVAFFVATAYYRDEHTDMLWGSFAAAQDLRICDALQALVSPVLNLFQTEHFVYLFGKFQNLPIQDFSPAIRQLLDSALTCFLSKGQVEFDFHAENEDYRFLLPNLLIRLIREASVVSQGGRLASPEVHDVAQARFYDLVSRGLHPDVRRAVYADCCSDIAAKTRTTLGSMWVLAICLRQPRFADAPSLMQDYDLPRSMVEELELATSNASGAESESVLTGLANSPRMQLLAAIVEHEPSPLPADLCIRLLDALVGSKAVSQDDRDTGWQILNVAGLNARKGSTFLSTCFTDYLPRIMPDHIRPGTLEFVKRILMKHVNFVKGPAILQDMGLIEEPEIENAALDDEKSFVGAGVEQLWRFLLSTTDETLVDAMIQILNDIYVESNVIQEYPYERARQVHLHVVERCIHQMQRAAEALDADESSDVSAAANSEALSNQRRIFTRSLAVLQAFLKAYRSTRRFSVPDLRSLMPEAPSQIQGDPADLKYQTFSGIAQSDIMPLAIGTKNTAASLLATLKEATGFDNYRVYYRGSPFTISEQDISRSLEELKIHNGLLLVKKEPTGADAPTKAKLGACGLEIKILEHFQPLWTYLSMEPFLARQVYYFLTNLPADSRQLELINSPSSGHQDIFPKGEPYKCMYAVYTLEQYLNTSRKRSVAVVAGGEEDDDGMAAAKNALARAWTLLVDAISDADLLSGSEHVLPKHQMSDTLMQLYLRVLNDSTLLGLTTIPENRIPAVGCLMDLARSALETPRHDHSCGLIQKVFTSLLHTSALSSDFWASFIAHPDTTALIEDVLIHENDPRIRMSAVDAIQQRSCLGSITLSVAPREFQDFFWPTLSTLISKATSFPGQCREFFTLVQTVLKSLCEEQRWDLLDPEKLVSECCHILLDYETTEVLGVPYVEDTVLGALAAIVHSILVHRAPESYDWEFPPRFAERLFWKHLFPDNREEPSHPVPRSVLNFHTRSRLYTILVLVTQNDESSTLDLVKSLNQLTQFDGGEEEPYEYELPQCLDRMVEVRSPCGYAGLRNLGNTCYLNSLLAQLFMNTNFRKFMVEAPVKDLHAQDLLLETRKLFCNMQDTIRRYVDTSSMVSTIKTYDDTGIDVGVQMDVDEFYNLLFDRWEGQLSTPGERQTFRTFYGGQLVQQVSSKECEHISERFEPFSAIQCDIKGKKNLAESLQAYVDGEVMQGDNKYKCSDCDRHVDAVKRACLKDVPDNLIFHLKRFDFNLRTMMRSKINDHFAFPPSIDMRPYTIEHLSGSAEKQEPDNFELVGILVHAGTAESGHYYSYIRQRPNAGEQDFWMEFNDDMVTAWDPKLMEEATFGTPEGRTYEHGGFSYEKSNNAYMLFYQRSSTLEAQRSAMLASGVKAPLRAETPSDIHNRIMDDNLKWLRRWCLFDPYHHQFVQKLADRLLASPNKTCPVQHRTQNRMMMALIAIYDQAATRSKDLAGAEPLRQTAQSAVENCDDCAKTLVTYFFNTHEPLKALVQRNADASVRGNAAELFMAAVKRIREHDPDTYGLRVHSPETYDLDSTVAGNCAILFDNLWSQFHTHTRSWAEVFGLVQSFAELGHYETALLLNEDWLWKMLMIVATDTSFPDLPEHFRRLHAIMSRRALNRPVNFAAPIQLIRHFMSALTPQTTARTVVDSDDRLSIALAEPGKLLPWSKSEVLAIRAESPYQSGSVFLRRLLDVEQALMSTEAILRVFAQGNKMMRIALHQVLLQALDDRVEVMSIKPYLRGTLVFVEADPVAQPSLELLKCAMVACRQSSSQHHVYMQFFRELDKKLKDDVLPEKLIYWASEWAPALLASTNRHVADQVELHLLEDLLPDPREDGDVPLPTAVTRAVREFALRSLNYLKREFGNRPVTHGSVDHLQRVQQHCEPFFSDEVSDDVQTITRERYNQIREEIYAVVQSNLVEELEDDGSDWDSSGHFESLAEMETQM